MAPTWGQLHKVRHVNKPATALEKYSALVAYFPIFEIKEKVKTFAGNVQDAIRVGVSGRSVEKPNFSLSTPRAGGAVSGASKKLLVQIANENPCRRKHGAGFPQRQMLCVTETHSLCLLLSASRVFQGTP